MLYVLYCRDKPDSLSLRTGNRPAHLEYASQAGERLRLAGPMLDADGMPCGSLMIMEAASQEAAELTVRHDPYFTAGLFEQVDVYPFKPVLGTWADAGDS